MEESQDESESAYLQRYDSRNYPSPLVTVDVVIFAVIDDALNVLLVKRGGHPEKGKWALPGGFVRVEEDRDLEAAALRRLRQETGVETPYLEQVATFGDGQRDARGWSLTVVTMALIDAASANFSSGETVQETRWSAVEHCADLTLAFDHARLLEAAVQRLRAKVEYTALPIHLMPEAFTLSELQRVFEIVLGRRVEKASFRRRIREASILEAIPGEKRRGSNRPAQLYRVVEGEGAHFFPRTLTGRRGAS
ncbi:MAG: NUDIX hydrolase [Magnetococcales bacterium]|nr:NUDIX hydrolase [Magnetococcales bacterium]